MPWTDDEKVALFECYQRTGGVKKGGYIKRTKELYDNLGFAPRSAPSLTTQLKRIEQGAICKFDRDEITKKVRWELLTEKVESEGGLEDNEILEVFGESFEEEYDYRDFSADASSVETTQEVDVNQGAEVDFVIEGVPLDMDPRVVLMKEVDTWKESDGNIRLLTEEENEVLLLLRKVCDSGEGKEIPNLRAYDRRKVMREVNLVDGVMHNVISENMNVTDVNRLLAHRLSRTAVVSDKRSEGN